MAGGRGGEGLEYLDVALAVEDAGLVDRRDAGDGGVARCGIVVDDALVGAFELQDHGVGGEGLEVWVKFL